MQACRAYGEQEMCVQSLVWKPEGKRSLGCTRRRCGDNIKRHFKGIGQEWSAFVWLNIGTDGGLL